ncbi:uncharacterized protein UV8b_07380 [Ustilaginoidea virens]|uniref:Uncharacterized protein n=1 Tax=Ustilaginoidea virens TaxID=1159556 RepID=A0A1B5L679_USTVR|nr:uncharacterized protein UV8b_07380 [Ustilaginoidea virens]QUC23139.1 hypothetical protein UV8b_07380 [Ustilaginoidea virens]GAO19081.1 hypothetical protein UVI_02062990 [Ustilaginoidea virens]
MTRIRLKHFLLDWQDGVSQQPRLTLLPPEIKYEVMSYLCCQALSRLGRTSTIWRDTTMPALYRLDAKKGNSSAIVWAAKVGVRTSRDMATKVLRNAVKYSGDVNTVHYEDPDNSRPIFATALHYAVASGDVGFVGELLHHGAKLDVPCSGLNWGKLIMGLKKPYFGAGESSEWLLSRIGQWLPFFVSYIRDDHDMAMLLVQHGASACVIDFRTQLEMLNLPSWGMTILHMIASDQSKKPAIWNRLLDIFKANINDRAVFSLDSVLHMVAKNGKLEVLKHAISAGAMLEGTDNLGRTPLVAAMDETLILDPGKWPGLVSCVECLVQHGALVNPRGGSALAQALRYYEANPVPHKGMMDLVQCLLKHGADINRRSSGGYTAVHALCLAIMRKGPDSLLRRLLERFIKDGGNVKLEVPWRHSLLYTAMVRYDSKPAWLFRLLLREGATIRQQEANEVFLKWSRTPHLHRKGKGYYDIEQHKADITMSVIQRAYRHAMSIRSPALFRALLRSGIEKPSNDFLVNTALSSSFSWIWTMMTRLDFAGTYVKPGSDMQTMLHLLVREFCVTRDYTDQQASKDARHLLRKGAVILAQDGEGKTALERLKEDPVARAKGCHILTKVLTQKVPRGRRRDEQEKADNSA